MQFHSSPPNYRNKTALLTIEFTFHRSPGYPDNSDSSFTLVTHKNAIDAPLLSIIRTHLEESASSKRENAIPRWVRSLMFPDPDESDSFALPQCVMLAKLDPLSALALQVKTAYYDMNPAQNLSVLLRGKYFVEFPTIDVWMTFRGTIMDTAGAITRHSVADERPRNTKSNPAAGKRTMATLLGGYGSDTEEPDGHADRESSLAALAAYTGSDSDHTGESDECDAGDGVDGDEGDFEMAEDIDKSGEPEEESQLEPEALLELMRKIQADQQKWNGEDDEVDWGSSCEEDR